MRELGHKAIGLAFWALFVVLWIILIRKHEAGSQSIAYSATYVGVIAGAVLTVTFIWIRHNTAIHERKGPRTGRPELTPRSDEDRLGRPIRWQLPDGHRDAALSGHLIVAVDGPAKVYRRASSP